MSVQTIANRGSSRSIGRFASTVTLGFAVGVAISLTAFLLARYGPSGDSWSFRGNGALAAYSLIPPAIAGGWTAVVLHHRHQPWLSLGLGALIVGVALAAVDAALLPVFGRSADQTLGPLVLVALVAWAIVAPAIAAVLPSRVTAETQSIGSSVAAAMLWAIGLGCGLVAAGLAFPAGS